MKVKQLKMKAFRGIQDLTLEFDQNLPTVLVGINGAGKSSVLDCLTVLLSHFIAKLRVSMSYNHLKGDTAKYFTDQDINTLSKETYADVSVILDEQTFLWSITKQIGQASTRPKIPRELQLATDNLSDPLYSGLAPKLTLIAYYPVNRIVIDIPLDVPGEYLLEHAAQMHAYDWSVSSEKVDFVGFFRWFRLVEDLENETRLNSNRDYRDKQLQSVRRAITSLIPEFSNLRVKRSPLRMTVTKQGQELIINQLSDGEKCLLAMVGDLARRLAIANPGLDNPLEGEGVVLIDEIELHLHPKWQRAIVPALTRTFPNCQFIVTTHSPQVLSEVQPNSIYILESTDRGVVAKRPTSSYGRDSNQILEDLMDVPERPEFFKEQLLEIFRLIDAGDLEGAKQLRQQIAGEIGADEPELVKASTSIRRREILNK